MDGLQLLVKGANSSDLAARARFGTLAPFHRCLLLQYVLVLPNSSLLVATLYLGPMGSLGSLWTYSEGMDGLHLLFKGANGSNLAAWARFGTLALFGGHLLLQYVWVQVNSSLLVASLSLGPMRSLWAYIEGMDDIHLLFMGANGSNLAVWARFGTLVPL